MKKGSITVFLTLTLVLVMSFVFSLLEAARVNCIQSRAKLLSQLCVQSVMGNYQRDLWDDYHLLAVDGNWNQGEFAIGFTESYAMELMKENGKLPAEYGGDGWDLMHLEVQDVMVKDYVLATDGKGRSLWNQVCEQMRVEAAADVLENLSVLKETGTEAEAWQGNNKRWEEALQALEQADEEKKNHGQTEDDNTEKSREINQETENPMEYVKQLKASSVLTFVVPEGQKLSEKTLEPIWIASRRALREGTGKVPEEEGSRLLFQYYIQQYFSNYTQNRKHGPEETKLDYEMEYLIGKRDSDVENLEQVVKKLLLFRETMNFATLMKDEAKKELALAIATAAVGFTGMVPLVKAVQGGVLLSWAYVESVMDVRTLLGNGKVPVMKRTDQWISDISDCRRSICNDFAGDSEEEGLTYGQYLQMLLFLESRDNLCMRCIDLMEQNEGICMDDMIVAADMEFSYMARPLFWNLSFLKNEQLSDLHFYQEQNFCFSSPGVL